jgi:hypothetical protein
MFLGPGQTVIMGNRHVIVLERVTCLLLKFAFIAKLVSASTSLRIFASVLLPAQ